MRRRRVLAALSILLMTLPTGLAHSDVIWIHAKDDAPSYTFSVGHNEGTFFNNEENYMLPLSDLDQKSTNETQGEFDPFDSVAVGDFIAFGGGPAGEVRMYAMAMGPDRDDDTNPANPADGLKVQACAQIIPESLNGNHGISVHQNVWSWSTRWFRVDKETSIELRATLDGTISFDEFDSDDRLYAKKNIYSKVTLEELVINGGTGEIISAKEIASVQATMEAPASTFLILNPTDSEGQQLTYQLKGLINLESDVSNLDLKNEAILATISGPFDLGTPESPLSLTATVTKTTAGGPSTDNQGTQEVNTGVTPTTEDSGGGGGGGCFIEATSQHGH
jgi:hypothetical protein